MFLGVLSAFGPFVMDMYLPTLPAMAGYFRTTASNVQLGLTTGMVGLAVGQLLFGPLSDRNGRRRPLLAAMALFLLATLACLFAPNIAVFVAFRFVQGVAGAGGVVISRSIAADRYVGHELAAMLALVGAVNGVATVAAPVGGGMLAALGGWHAQPGLPFLYIAIRLCHVRAFCQHRLGTLHHAAALRTDPLAVQPVFRHQCRGHGGCFYAGGQTAFVATRFAFG